MSRGYRVGTTVDFPLTFVMAEEIHASGVMRCEKPAVLADPRFKNQYPVFTLSWMMFSYDLRGVLHA